MRNKLIKGILLLISFVCILSCPVSVSAQPQGTTGDEMQLMEASDLEIQLGPDWAGVEFQLKTDVGMYPGTVVVGEDGVLRMEIGGSKSYVLSCLGSSVDAPVPTRDPAVSDNEKKSSDTAASDRDNAKKNTIAGIPIVHMILFVGGMTLAVGSLIIMQILKKRRETGTQFNDEDDE